MESCYSLRIQIKSSYDLVMLKIRLLHHHVKHHTWFISLNSALRPSSDSVLHMSPIECTDDKNPLFSLISIRFGSYEVRRLKLAVVGVEDSADVKQQSTKGQENEKKKMIKTIRSLSGFPLWYALCLLHLVRTLNYCTSSRERQVLWRIENGSIFFFLLVK